MNFTIEQKAHAAIFRPKEARLDSILAPELKAEFLILAQPDVETLVIDLTEVEYIDSAGLSALLLARRQQSSHDGDVRLVAVHDDVRSLLELTQLNRVFPMYTTIAEALEAPSLSSVVVPADEADSGAFGVAAKVVAIGGGVAALGAIALGDGDDDLDDDDFDDDDFDDDDDDFDDEPPTEKKDDEEEVDEDEEDDDEDDVEIDEDIELEDDLDFDEDDDDDEDF